MRNNNLFLIAFLILPYTVFSQETKLTDLSDFDKIIISGPVNELNIVGRSNHGPSITIEGRDNSGITAKIEAGIMYLDIKSGEEVSVHVFNNDLKRAEGPESMLLSGAETIGSNGKYLITSFNRGHHTHKSFRTDHIKSHRKCDDFAISLDYDFDLDLDFDQINHEIHRVIQDNKSEIKIVSKEISKEIKEVIKEVQRELEDIKID